MALTKRRQLFVHEYATNPKAGQMQAVVRAGFSPKRAKETACELMKDPEIKAAIERKLAGQLESVHVDEKLVVTGLLRTIERCIDAGSGAWQTNGILKSYELLGRYLKMFTEKIEIDLGERIMEALTAGRKRAGLTIAEKATDNATPSQIPGTATSSLPVSWQSTSATGLPAKKVK
jgi:phage terminase small subunit